jgi:L-ascorbate metabolism protein UlaG (beta-lactamase superfamily)
VAKKSIRWLSHACFGITSPGGKVIITDPWLLNNPLCPVKVGDIKTAHIITVSHDHFDHWTGVAELAKQTGAAVVCEPETADRFKRELGIPEANIVYFGSGMNIGGSVVIEGITVTMTQAYHSSATGSPAGYVIKLEDSTTIYHAGDTGIFEEMRLLGELYPLDLALIPIGSAFVMDSYQAAKSLSLLRPKKAIPMHYKTFPILEQSADNFVKLAKKEAPKVQVVVLDPGQEYSW